MREDLSEPATPVTTVNTPNGMSTSRSWRLLRDAPRISRWPVGLARILLDRGLLNLDSVRGDDFPAGHTRARPEFYHAIRNGHCLRVVLHQEHRAALIAQLQQQVVRLRNVGWAQAGGRFVENVSYVRERRTDVADHARALHLTATERARRALQGQVAQADRATGRQPAVS